ncbi:MAG: DUF5615 family PIN-like protein [Planctomycetes bacterium]|nr:DUF5615 family PIN-like protein [Planctomycetota bacterium]
MLRLLADENFNDRIVRGLLRRRSDLDIVRVQEIGLSGADDPPVLEWAAEEERILLTHDRKTVPRHAYRRIQGGKRMPGVFVVDDRLPVGRVIEDILLLAECSLDEEWEGQVRYLPL